MSCPHCYRNYTASLLSRRETPLLLRFTTSSTNGRNATTTRPRYFTTASQRRESQNEMNPPKIGDSTRDLNIMSEEEMQLAKKYIANRNVQGAIRRDRHTFLPPEENRVNAFGKPVRRGGLKVFEERPAQVRGRSTEFAGTGDSVVDPYVLSDDTSRLLETHGVEAALKLVRKQGSTINTVVSWNLIIQNRMGNNAQAQALKLYNEMKKIGIEPDSRTYGIILDGLSLNDKYKPALASALSIYHQLASPSSLVKLNIFHTNAVLKCCLRWRDVDAMWTIAERIPASGRSMADARTYTTMLNTIRVVADGGKERALVDAMSLWEGVITRWQNGTLHIDEQLACSMARVLLSSSRAENWDSIFSLVQQVFGIPRLVPKLGTKANTMRRGWPEDVTSEEEDMPSAYAEVPPEETVVDVPQDPHMYKTHLFDVLMPETERHALVGTNVLSVVMSACIALRAYREGEEYWKILSPAVTPDLDNHLYYLRLLAGARNSRAAIDHIKSMQVSQVIMPLSANFIAISACQRNRDLMCAYKDALTLLNLMHTHKDAQDPRVLMHFINIAIASDDNTIMKAAWDRIGPHYINLREILSTEGKTLPQMERVFKFCNSMVSLCDKLLHRMSTISSDEELQSMRQHRQKLNAFITQTFNQDGRETGDPRTMKRMKDARRRAVEGKDFQEVQRSGKRWEIRGVLGPNWQTIKGGDIAIPTSMSTGTTSAQPVEESFGQDTPQLSTLPVLSASPSRPNTDSFEHIQIRTGTLEKRRRQNEAEIEQYKQRFSTSDKIPHPEVESSTRRFRPRGLYNPDPHKLRDTDNLHLVPSGFYGEGLKVDRSFDRSNMRHPTYQPVVRFAPTKNGLLLSAPGGDFKNSKRSKSIAEGQTVEKQIMGFEKKIEARPVLTPGGVLAQPPPWSRTHRVAKKSWISAI